MKKIERRNFLKAMGLSTLALGLAACGGSDAASGSTASSAASGTAPAGGPKMGGTLRLCYNSLIASPGYTPRASANADLFYLTLSYENLFTYDTEGTLVPKLATAWEVDAEEPSITWTLREGVNFADGEPFNAEAVKRNIEEYQVNNRTEVANIAECQVIDSPWADAKVRRAMCYAIDCDALNAAFLMGAAELTDQWAVPGSVTYNDNINHYTYDPERAKELLAEAGYADGFDTKITTVSAYSDMFTAVANMLAEVGIRCEIQQVDGATQNQIYADGTWERLMPHYATVSPDLGLYMGRHLDYNGAYYAKGIQHPDKEMQLLEEIRYCMDPDQKHELEKQLQAAIYDAKTGSCLFGRPLYVNTSSMYKYNYVTDDHATEAFVSAWDLSTCWLNR
ncbi:ABC transporter substrate-binding protein [uncultured Subdoligranulum sp.]|uniref:ABC transporter substrate-binding protein n=1 Tax=uncultured Subdoligranulum sp. TaxID=512298 RepID=UPI002621D37B|nr:ABC transporter substrate-binding protein [uncultured Subdoligranulum sp.]